MYTSLYINTPLYIHTTLYIYIPLYIHTYPSIYIHTPLYTYSYIYIPLNKCISTPLYIYTYISIYIYIPITCSISHMHSLTPHYHLTYLIYVVISDPCLHKDCGLNKRCEPYDGTCSCIPGWTGPSCLTNYNDCKPNKCKNAATCVDMLGAFACICHWGFMGRSVTHSWRLNYKQYMRMS